MVLFARADHCSFGEGSVGGQVKVMGRRRTDSGSSSSGSYRSARSSGSSGSYRSAANWSGGSRRSSAYSAYYSADSRVDLRDEWLQYMRRTSNPFRGLPRVVYRPSRWDRFRRGARTALTTRWTFAAVMIVAWLFVMRYLLSGNR